MRLAPRTTHPEDDRVQGEPVVHREEVEAMLFAIADMNVHVARILELLEGEIGGEEEVPEDDA